MPTTSTGKMKSVQTEHAKIYNEFDEFIIDQNHPCVMAQTVFNMEHVDFHVYSNFGTKQTAIEILEDLKAYLANYNFESNDFYTFIAVFKEKKEYSEKEFEQVLWKQLQLLHEIDEIPWDKEVSKNPENGHFSFSINGKAFYIVGMHPNSSRKSRQSPYPAIALNLHWQFEKLREMNVFHNVRNKIRDRDIELQGNINPMLQDFGTNSEARQYSGRKVDKAWKCPFHQANK